MFKWFEGYRTYIAAAGLAGLAMYQFSQGQFELGTQSLLGALAAFGLRAAIDKPKEGNAK